MLKILGFFRHNWIRMLISLGVGLAIMSIYNASYQSSGASAWSKIEYYRDGSFIAAMTLIFVGLLSLLTHFGAFNMFSFYFNRKRKDNGYKENYTEYSERKRIERGSLDLYFLSYIIIGLLFLIFSIIVFIVLK